MWSHWAPTCGRPFRDGFPLVSEILDRLGEDGLPPAAGSYHSERRLEQLRDAGWSIPASWQDQRRTFGESEIGAVMPYTGLLWWPEVVAPTAAGRRAPPWRMDCLAMARVDKDWWRLLAIEVDGPQHLDRRDADERRDRELLRMYGVEVYRVSAEWARTDPWATIAAVLDAAGATRKPDFDFVGLGSPDDYVCEICTGPIQRRDPHDLVMTDVGAAHRDCAERASWRAP